MSSLKGKVALVTGASRGIGAAAAKRLGREGATVAVNYAGNAEAAETVVQAIRAAGGEARAFQADTTEESEVRALFEAVTEAFGGLDVVVLNAHPGSGRGLIAELDVAEFDQQAKVLRGQFVALQEAARRVADGGCIITISSGTTRMARPHNALYSGMKSALEQFSRVLSKEIGWRGVNVNIVSPGATATERLTSGGRSINIPPTTPPDYPPTQFDRPGTPEEIAEAICFLATPAGRWINSQNITVNGGATWHS